MEKVIVYDSIGNIKRYEKPSDLDTLIREGVFLLNVACKIKPIYISKELGIIVRNLNDYELNFCYKKIKEDIYKSINIEDDLIIRKFEKYYNKDYNVEENLFNLMGQSRDIISNDLFIKICNYFYSKDVYESMFFKKKKIVNLIDIKNKKEISEKIAREFCSDLIVIEIEDYNKIYNIMDKYYNLDNEIVKVNYYTKKFIDDLIKFCNIIYLGEDICKDETKFTFKIYDFFHYEYSFMNLSGFYDKYNRDLNENNISNKLDKIDNLYIDSYIKNNKENLNNLVFIVSRLYTENDIPVFNYREYNLSLISILELLLVNSKSDVKINEKLIKNVLICLSVNNNLNDYLEEKKIIKEIYSYRSMISHGNYPGLKSSIHNLEILLKNELSECEDSIHNVIEYLISKKLNLYIKSVFEIYIMNNMLIKILKD